MSKRTSQNDGHDPALIDNQADDPWATENDAHEDSDDGQSHLHGDAPHGKKLLTRSSRNKTSWNADDADALGLNDPQDEHDHQEGHEHEGPHHSEHNDGDEADTDLEQDEEQPHHEQQDLDAQEKAKKAKKLKTMLMLGGVGVVLVGTIGGTFALKTNLAAKRADNTEMVMGADAKPAVSPSANPSVKPAVNVAVNPAVNQAVNPAIATTGPVIAPTTTATPNAATPATTPTAHPAVTPTAMATMPASNQQQASTPVPAALKTDLDELSVRLERLSATFVKKIDDIRIQDDSSATRIFKLETSFGDIENKAKLQSEATKGAQTAMDERIAALETAHIEDKSAIDELIAKVFPRRAAEAKAAAEKADREAASRVAKEARDAAAVVAAEAKLAADKALDAVKKAKPRVTMSEYKSPEVKPAEVKSAEVKSSEVKSSEVKPAQSKPAPVVAAKPPASPIDGYRVVATYPATQTAGMPAQKAWVTNGQKLIEVVVGSSINGARVTGIQGVTVQTSAGTILAAK